MDKKNEMDEEDCLRIITLERSHNQNSPNQVHATKVAAVTTAKMAYQLTKNKIAHLTQDHK